MKKILHCKIIKKYYNYYDDSKMKLKNIQIKYFCHEDKKLLRTHV